MGGAAERVRAPHRPRGPARVCALDALRLAQASVAAAPEALAGYSSLAWAQLRTGADPATVIESFQKALAEPEIARSPDPWYGLTLAALQAERPEDARTWKAKGDAALLARPLLGPLLANLKAEVETALASSLPAAAGK